MSARSKSQTLIDWCQIDTVMLDMDGTLLDLHFDNYFWQEHLPQRYAEIHGIHPGEATKNLFPKMREHEGTLNWYCLDFWSTELEVDIVALKLEIRERIRILPGVEVFLSACREHDKRVYLVTNAHRGSLDIKMDKTGLDRYFDALISSHDYGAAKEQALFWGHLQNALKFDAQRSLFVDDSKRVLDAAKAYGIGKVFAISWPDTRQPVREVSGHQNIQSFQDLLPLS